MVDVKGNIGKLHPTGGRCGGISTARRGRMPWLRNPWSLLPMPRCSKTMFPLQGSVLNTLDRICEIKYGETGRNTGCMSDVATVLMLSCRARRRRGPC